MRSRMVVFFLVGVLAGVPVLAGGLYAAHRFTEEAEAQAPTTWQIAGPPDGFAVADLGAGLGPERSLDEWILQLPANCDFKILDRGVSFDTILYRCPEE